MSKLTIALAGTPMGSSKEESDEDDFECPPELKLAAYEILDALGVGYGSDGDRAQKLVRALWSFFTLVESMPHKEAGEAEG